VISGNSSVDQAPISGESVPVDKVPGDPVFAGTVNKEGSLTVRVTKAAGYSTLARII
jgi:Zn2+/Cd2+-exporting ATPase